MDKVLQLFSTPLQISKLSVSQSVLQFIKSQKFKRHANGYITHESILECPELEIIKSFITNKVKSYLYDTCLISDTMMPELVTSWVNLHTKGDWAQIHNHTNSIVSGVWYLSTTPNSGNFLVHTDNKLFGNVLDFPRKDNLFNSNDCAFLPQNGDLILFPSNLKHNVTPNRSDEERLSLAFNYMLRGDVISGSPGNTVKL